MSFRGCAAEVADVVEAAEVAAAAESAAVVALLLKFGLFMNASGVMRMGAASVFMFMGVGATI